MESLRDRCEVLPRGLRVDSDRAAVEAMAIFVLSEIGRDLDRRCQDTENANRRFWQNVLVDQSGLK